MSSFPRFPACEGPMSLKQFLGRYFFIDVIFTTNATSQPATDATSRSAQSLATPSQRVELPVTAHLVLSVYVLKSAPPPPPWMPSSPAEPLTPASRHCAAARAASSTPVTRAVLDDPFFATLFARLGPAVEAYMARFCPVVAQFEMTGGGLQVLGPSLLALVPRRVTTASVRGEGGAWRKRARCTSEERVVTHHRHRRLAPRQTTRSTDWYRHRRRGGRRLEAAARGDPCVSPPENLVREAPAGRRTTADEAGRLKALLSIDVGRTVLLHRKPCRLPRFTSNTAGATTPHQSVPERWMDTLWDAAHTSPSSAHQAPLQRTHTPVPSDGVHPSAAVQAPQPPPPSRRRRRRRHRHGSTSTIDTHLPAGMTAIDSETVTAHEPTVELVQRAWVPFFFPFTCAAHADACDTLHAVLTDVVRVCQHVDVRGVTLRHTRFLEQRFATMQVAHHRQLQRASVAQSATTAPAFNVSHLSAPVDVVVAYLRDILARFRCSSSPVQRRASKAAPTVETHGASTNQTAFFWGMDAAGTTANLDAVCAVLRDWLNAGRRGSFPLSRFLDGVRVGQMPWLSPVVDAAAADSASDSPRGVRSRDTQRTYLECMLFLLQHVLPFFVQRAFHVTWRAREPNTFVFIPLVVWRRLVRRELRQWSRSAAPTATLSTPVSPDTVHDVHGNNTIERRAVRRLESPAEVWQHASTCPMPQHVLYASVRLLPDRHKLRPIAVVRCAHARALSRLARGLPRLSATARAGSSSSSPPPMTAPPSVWMRSALACLVSELDSQRASQGLPSFINRTHRDEYPELRALAMEYQRLWRTYEQARRQAANTDCDGSCAAASPSSPRMISPPVLSLIHADAARCYERLPQEAVAAVVDDLIRDDVYYAVHFTALRESSLHTVATQSSSPATTTLGSCPRSTTEKRARSPECAVCDTQVRQSTWFRMVPAAQLRTHQLLCIPRHTILCESANTTNAPASAGHRQPHEGSPTTTTSGTASGALTGAVVSGAAVRDWLRHHVQNHLIVVHSPASQRGPGSASAPHAAAPTPTAALFSQRIGIVQGSPVAMLLCDAVLQRVDAALAACLEHYHEYSLLLRRVDDLLVATFSPVAAEACVRMVKKGWTEVGYLCEPSKLQHARGHTPHRVPPPSTPPPRTVDCVGDDAERYVPWCGLFLSARTAEVSVDWRRVRPLLSSLHRTTAVGLGELQDGGAHVGQQRLRINMHRLLTRLSLRTPPITLCRRVNSRARVLQTIYEISLLTVRFLLGQVAAMLPRCRPRLRLVLGPYRVCERRLARLVSRQRRVLFLTHHSFCDVTEEEVRLCLCVAMHRTLQSQLRQRMAQQPPPSSPSRCARSRPREAVLQHRRQLWWVLTRRFTQRSRRALRRDLAQHYVRTRLAARARHETHAQEEVLEVPWRAADTSPAAALLLATGGESLSALALAAVSRQ